MTLQIATNMRNGPKIRAAWRVTRSRTLLRNAAQYSSSTATLYAGPAKTQPGASWSAASLGETV